MGIYEVVQPDRIDDIGMHLTPIVYSGHGLTKAPTLVRLLVPAGLFTFLYFRLITFKFSLFQHEARVLDLSMPKLMVGSGLQGCSALMCWKNLIHSWHGYSF